MPKTPNTSTHRPALRRNQACRSCRKRKLKCDAGRPHCGTCVKQWQALISVPAPVGYAHPAEPQCSYDPVEGLTLAPDVDPLEKIKQLENEISHLKSRLYDRDDPKSRSISPTRTQANPSVPERDPITLSPLSSGSQYDISGISLPQASLSLSNTPDIPAAPLRYVNPDIHVLDSPEPPMSGFMDLLFSGWNPDLPDPATLNHYIDTFFKCDPCGPRVLHRPSFVASMHLSPRDPGFPHSAVLHAICAVASRWSPRNVVVLPDGTKRDQFAEFHASKTRQYIDKTMASGEDIFAVVQACTLLSWYFYQEGRWVEVWVFAGFQTRVAIPLRLNYPGTGCASPGAYLAPPKDLRELESRRRVWWMAILFDRIASVGGWIHGIDERDIGTELPLRADDFESEAAVPSNPQNLTFSDFFTRHPPQHTDSFILLIKAVMLFGKVTDYNVRGNLHGPMITDRHINPFQLDGFKQLDKLVSSEFSQCLPPIYKNNNGVTSMLDGDRLDTDLYMVHLIPHAATITLHNPYIDFTDPQSVSTARCVHAARSILGACSILSATSFDISRLHPFVTICWYLAAVVQVQLCKYFIEINDPDRESTVWGEINALRFAMMEYGRRSPIGTRQERLLQGLMREIVRMTAQKQPLAVGVPLYPFSPSTLWRTDELREVTETAGAPFPVPQYDERYEEKPLGRTSVVEISTRHRLSPEMGTWSMHQLPPGM